MSAIKKLRFLYIYYLIIPILSLCAVFVFFLNLIPPKEIRILSGPQDGYFAVLAEQIKEDLKAFSIEATIEYFNDTAEIIHRLDNQDEKKSHIGFLSQDISDQTFQNIYSLGAVAIEPLWVFINKKRNISNIRQLKGLSIAVGPKTSTVGKLSRNVLSRYGINDTNTIFVDTVLTAAGDQLVNESIDAAFFLIPINTPILRTLALHENIGLLDISEAEAISHLIAHVERVTVPKGAFTLFPLSPEKDTDAIALPVSVVISKESGAAFGALVALILKKRYSDETFFTQDQKLPDFLYKELIPLPSAKSIYAGEETYLSEVFGEKYGLLILYSTDPLVFLLVTIILFFGIIITYVEIVPVLIGVKRLFYDVDSSRQRSSK